MSVPVASCAVGGLWQTRPEKDTGGNKGRLRLHQHSLALEGW